MAKTPYTVVLAVLSGLGLIRVGLDKIGTLTKLDVYQIQYGPNSLGTKAFVVAVWLNWYFLPCIKN